jgi:hypothetical protein
VPSRFSDHFEIADDCIDRLAIVRELLARETLDVARDGSRRLDNSSMRIRQSLGGTDGLSQHSLPKLRLQGSGRNEVDSGAQNLFEKPTQAHKLKKTDRNAKLDEEIHVAVGAGVATRHRPEYCQALDVESIQRFPL